MPLTKEEEDQIQAMGGGEKAMGHIQRRYAMTPVKRQNDYDHAACGIEGANYEDRLIKALCGHPSEEFGGAFDWLVRTYTPEHFGVPDRYNLGEYVAELKKLHDVLLKGMIRASDSTYRFTGNALQELRQK